MLSMSSSNFGGKLRLAVVGSGPAGFYTALKIIKKAPNVLVDILEKLPVPFGLVRFGVAPDHPEVKNVINQFSDLAKSERCRFIGNTNVGKDVSVNELKHFYNGVILSYGAEEDKLLNIPGENLNGVHSARNFVGWYNGLPEHVNLNPDLSGETAAIIGHGNVALDVARILLSPLDTLKTTDISSHAFDSLCKSNIRKVILIGRRGPLQVAFTIKELREMTRLPDCQSIFHSNDFDQCRSLVNELARPRKRITELMIKTAETSPPIKTSLTSKTWELRFLSNPVEILSSDSGTVRGIKLEKNQLTEDNRAKGIGEFEEIECSLLMRSIGYRSVTIDDSVPFDSQNGLVPNRNGRVVDSNNQVIKGLYCSGWIKRGPVGVIVTTMNDAFQTADSIIDDINSGHLLPFEHSRDIIDILKEPVLFSDWEKIDREEQRRGKERNKLREKIVSIEEMLRIIK